MKPYRTVHRKSVIIGNMHAVTHDGLCALLANLHDLAPDDNGDGGVGVNRPQFFQVVEGDLNRHG